MEIRRANEADEEGIRSLFAICFGREMFHQEWTWKYKSSPWGSSAVVAVDGKEIVAHYGGLRTKFAFNSRTLDSFQFCDVMTHPEYRGRFVSKTPIIVSLGSMFYEKNQMDFAFGFPSLRHAKLQSIRLGGEGYRFVRLYKKETLSVKGMVLGLTVREGWHNVKAKDFNKFTFLPLDQPLRLMKDERYLKWRFEEHPSKIYKVLVFKKFHVTKGYIVFTTYDNWFTILDIFYRDAKECRNILIATEKYILQNFHHIRGIKVWFHPKETVTSYVETLGYTSEDTIPIAFKQVKKGCGVTSEIFYENYCYRMGDYDSS